MKEKEARNIGAKYWNKYANIAVDSAGSVYLNANLSEVEKHCKSEKLELFICKGYERTDKKSKGDLPA